MTLQVVGIVAHVKDPRGREVDGVLIVVSYAVIGAVAVQSNWLHLPRDVDGGETLGRSLILERSPLPAKTILKAT